MNFLGKAFSEPLAGGQCGKASSHRLLVAFACVTILGTWATVSLEKRELQPLDVQQAGIVVGALGVGAWKRGKEGETAKIAENTKIEPTTK